jgi:hypothetical protein
MAWVGLCDMSLGLWCAGVELKGGGRWRGEGQVETCRADGPGVVKGGGLNRGTWRPGDQLRWLTSRTSTSASVHGWWRRRQSSHDGGRWRRGTWRRPVGQVKKEGEGVELGGGRTRVNMGGLVVSSSKPSVHGFTGLDLKTRAEFSRRNGWHVAALRSLHRGEAISWRVRWPSDEDYLELDHNTIGLCGSTQNI